MNAYEQRRKATLDHVTRELVATYLNGNISDVKAALSNMPPLEAAYVALEIAEQCTAYKAATFKETVQGWAL
jgi:hypothetical protein